MIYRYQVQYCHILRDSVNEKQAEHYMESHFAEMTLCNYFILVFYLFTVFVKRDIFESIYLSRVFVLMCIGRCV